MCRRRLLLQLDFFVYSRDAAGTAELRDDLELLEEHWSYMDRFAESMIARGPTLDTRRQTANLYDQCSSSSSRSSRSSAVPAASRLYTKKSNCGRSLRHFTSAVHSSTEDFLGSAQPRLSNLVQTKPAREHRLRHPLAHYHFVHLSAYGTKAASAPPRNPSDAWPDPILVARLVIRHDSEAVDSRPRSRPQLAKSLVSSLEYGDYNCARR